MAGEQCVAADVIRGGGRYPRCGCRKVIRAEFPTERCGDFYAHQLAGKRDGGVVPVSNGYA